MDVSEPYTIVMIDMVTGDSLADSRRTISSTSMPTKNDCQYWAHKDSVGFGTPGRVQYLPDRLYRIDMFPADPASNSTPGSYYYSFPEFCTAGSGIFCPVGKSGGQPDLVFFIGTDGPRAYLSAFSAFGVGQSVEAVFGLVAGGESWVLPYDASRYCALAPGTGSGSSGSCTGATVSPSGVPSNEIIFLSRIPFRSGPQTLPVPLHATAESGWRVPVGLTYTWSSADVSEIAFGRQGRLVVDGTLNSGGLALAAGDAVQGWRGLSIAGGSATLDGVRLTGVSYDDGSHYKRANSAVTVTGGATLTLRNGTEVSGARMAQGVEATGATVIIEGPNTQIFANNYTAVVAMPGASVTIRDRAQITGNTAGILASGYDARIFLDNARIASNTGTGVSAVGGGLVRTVSAATQFARTEVIENRGGLDASGSGSVQMGSCNKFGTCSNSGHQIIRNAIPPGATTTFFDASSTGGSAVRAQGNDWAVGSVNCLVLPKDGSSTLLVAPIIVNGPTTCPVSLPGARAAGAPSGTFARSGVGSGVSTASRGGVESALAAVIAAEEALDDGDEAGATALISAALDAAETDDERAGVYGGATRILAQTQPAGLVAVIAARAAGANRPFALRALAVAAASAGDATAADGFAASLASEYAGTAHEAGALAMRTRLAARADDEAGAMAHLGTLWALAPTSADFATGAAVVAAAFPDADLEWAPGDMGAGKAGTPDVATAPLAARLTVWPNPTTGAARMSIPAETGETLAVSVYDGLGRRVAVVADGVTATGGAFEAALPAESLPPGIYLVRVERRGVDGTVSVAVARLTVVR